MLEGLSPPDRLLLLKFLCAYAWTDLVVSEKERRFVKRLVERLGLDREDARQVESWLDVAPPPSSVDPKNVPSEHRQVFVDAVRALIYSDGTVDAEERSSLDQLRTALLGSPQGS